MSTEAFEGFPSETIDFLWDLRFHNNKEWFEENRERYKKYLKEPFDCFAADMNEVFMQSHKGLKTFATVSRINRDIRFSKNKMPYKECKWVVFKDSKYRGRVSPDFFFEVNPDGYTFGMGFYQCGPAVMQKFRKKVDANPKELERLAIRLREQQGFILAGEKYKRKFSDVHNDIVMDWYQRKTIAIVFNNELSQELFNREILTVVDKGFQFLFPYYEYLLTLFTD